MQKITPFLWFNDNVEAAVSRYMEIFRDGSIGTVSRNPQDGKVMIMRFSIMGQQLTAINGGPTFRLTEAFSLVVSCDDQDEIDYYWEALAAEGGEPGRCGWLKDAFGLSWQVIPARLPALMSQPDPEAAGRVFKALMGMDKLVIAALEAAAREEQGANLQR